MCQIFWKSTFHSFISSPGWTPMLFGLFWQQFFWSHSELFFRTLKGYLLVLPDFLRAGFGQVIDQFTVPAVRFLALLLIGSVFWMVAWETTVGLDLAVAKCLELESNLALKRFIRLTFSSECGEPGEQHIHVSER